MDCGGLLSGWFTQPPSGRTHRHAHCTTRGNIDSFLFTHPSHCSLWGRQITTSPSHIEKKNKFSFFEFPLSWWILQCYVISESPVSSLFLFSTQGWQWNWDKEMLQECVSGRSSQNNTEFSKHQLRTNRWAADLDILSSNFAKMDILTFSRRWETCVSDDK